MLPSVALVIREDPSKTHRPVEALRIALGLSTGGNPLTIILLNHSPLLLTDDADQILDVETLEKYLPALKSLGVPFFVPQGTAARLDLDPDFNIREASPTEVASLIAGMERVLLF